MAKLLRVANRGQAIAEMAEVAVCQEGIDLMVDKMLFLNIKLESVRNAIANIIKQEMLSVGGDAAVNAGAVNCTVAQSDVILMGTVKQLKKFVQKMRVQVSESPKYADEVEKILNTAVE